MINIFNAMFNQKNLNRIVFFLSLVGIAIAIYVSQSFLRKASIVCISTGCETVRKSPLAYPFGIPVPLFGLVGYFILATCAFLRTMKQKTHTLVALANTMLGVAIFGVSFVSWFTYTEIFIIRGICMWCGISAINMYVIFGILMYERKLQFSGKE